MDHQNFQLNDIAFVKVWKLHTSKETETKKKGIEPSYNDLKGSKYLTIKEKENIYLERTEGTDTFASKTED